MQFKEAFMSVANLTRYEPVVRRVGGSDVAKMSVWKNGDYVKFEEAMEASSNSLQQLKAEIAALIPGIVTSFTLCDEKQFIALTNELRQLSAV
jgi:hypothetical protein